MIVNWKKHSVLFLSPRLGEETSTVGAMRETLKVIAAEDAAGLGDESSTAEGISYSVR